MKDPLTDPSLEERMSDDLRRSISSMRDVLDRRRSLVRERPVDRVGRFRIVRKLGEGATGSVFAATDGENGLPVALKILHRFDPARLASFKSEFRVASRCAHRSLVSIFELVEDEGRWAIAMELVDGPPLLEHLAPLPDGNGRRLWDLERFRGTMLQIVEGLAAIHQAGILHRDLKPSNVLVNRDGSIRIADFGLATLLDEAGVSSSSPEGVIVGTPAYMAPELADNGPMTQASDLYSLGVILYEALTGTLPFSGTVMSIVARKFMEDAPDPAELAPDADPELLALTRALLARAPSARPPLEEVAASLGGRSPRSRARARGEAPPLVGRAAEVASLCEAFDRTSNGRPEVQRVEGPSGVGKSALLREVARRLESDRGAAVLSGRCHELESIPHKGFDAIVDHLRLAVMALPPRERERIVPRDAADASRMFPVLADVAPHTGASRGEASVDERMRRAREAVVGILRGFHSVRPLVLVLDDAQWGDAEGGALLEAIVTASPPCVRMVVLAYRPSEAEDSRLLAHLDHLGSVHPDYVERRLRLGPLDDASAHELVRSIVSEDATTHAIVEESRGEPFLLEQLALAHREGRTNDVAIESMVLSRAQSFGEEAVRMITYSAVAGTPLPERFLSELAEIEDARPLLHVLVANSLLRRTGSGESGLVHPYHDKIRTGVTASLDPARRRSIHRRIAELGESTNGLPSALLTRHFESADDLVRAAEHAHRAAVVAERSLAFDAAAAMHARVIALSQDEARRSEARVARARALFIAGRCDEAGAAFFEAAGSAPPAEAHELRREAVYAYLSFGCVAEGLDILRPMLAEAGLPFPTTPGEILWAAARAIAEVRVRTWVRPKVRASVDAELARRADLAWSAGIGLTNVSPAQGVCLTMTSLALAIRSGCPTRIARGLSFAGSGYVPGLVGIGEEYLAWAGELVEAAQDEDLRVFLAVSSGTRGFMLGDFERCLRDSHAALELAARTPHPTSWYQAVARTFAVGAHEYTGDYRQMEASCREFLRTTRGRGDLINEVSIVSALGYPLAARHDAAGLEGVIAEMSRLMAEWTLPYPFWKAFQLRLRCLRKLCWGEVEAARELLESEWPNLERHRLLDLPIVVHPMNCLRSALWLEAARAGHVDPRAAFAIARASARTLDGAQRAEGPTAAEIVRASISHLQSRPDRRDQHLERATAKAREGKMRAIECMVRRASAILGGRRDEVLALEAELHALGVTDAAAWARFVTPALPGSLS